jgi:ATP-binding cassette subfamily F protein uup
MDKIVDHLFVFNGDGNIKDFPGSYTIWRNKQLEEEEKEKKEKKPETKTSSKPAKEKERKLSFNEKKELEQLEKEIESLESEKAQIDVDLNSGTLANDQLLEKSHRYGVISDLLEEKEMRWLELSELA